jgi:signal transduction histidine kinase/ActR/RegA family two-component response regulator
MNHRYYRPFLYSVVALGGMVLLYSLFLLRREHLDWPFLFLAAVTITVASRLSIKIPRVHGEITVSDTIIFLTLLLYGPEAGIVVAALDGLGSSLHVSRKLRVLLFNTAQMICSTFLTTLVLRGCFGSIRGIYQLGLPHLSFAAICVMALVQYAGNSGLVAVYTALKTSRPVWETWRSHYLWTSLTYLAGACIAAISARFIGGLSIYTLLMVSPIVAIIYVTYKTYLKNVQASSDKAEQARQHFQELSLYVAEQERIRKQFSQVEKMSALGELASGVAHDFNNTLASILGRAQLMMRKVEDDETRRGLEIIIKSANDGAGTVKRIQDFARQRRDHDFEPVAVDQLLIDVNEITRPRWKDRAQASNVHINLNLQINSNALVLGDPSELREVLVNMVFNAVDAMPQGGRLTLSADEVGDKIRIAVSDTGIGMSEETCSRVFDPFFTTKGEAGMGLGLAVCYGIIQRHGGSVDIDSDVGEGTTFRITLPKAEASIKAEPATQDVARLRLVRKSTKPSILIVDDEECVRELLVDILESEGYEVTTAENGEQALKEFEEKRFKAVFTDVGMPGMSGWELARTIRERDNQIPLAVITGWGESVSSNDQELARVNWVVSKPFSVDRITEIAMEVAKHSGMDVSSMPIAATGT